MWEIKNDIAKNRIYMKLDGYFTIDDVKEASSILLQKTSELKPGIDVVNDISKFKAVNDEAQAEIIKAQRDLMAKGVKRVIRVVGSIVGKMQFNRLTEEAEAGYEVVEVNSFEDADSYLDTH